MIFKVHLSLNLKKVKFCCRSFLFLILIFLAVGTQAQPDTVRCTGTDPQSEIKWQHQYHQTLVMKLFLSQALYDEKFKKKDNGESKVYCTIEEALNIIKKVDNLTLGIPKLGYLLPATKFYLCVYGISKKSNGI